MGPPTSLFLDRQLVTLPPALAASLVTPSLVATSFHWPAVSLLCCHTLPSMGILPVTSAWSLAVTPHPTVTRFPGQAVTLLPPAPLRLRPSPLSRPRRRPLSSADGPPFVREGPLCAGVQRSSLSHCPLFWWTRPLPGAGRDWPPGSRAPRPAPPRPRGNCSPGRGGTAWVRLAVCGGRGGRCALSLTCGQSWPRRKPLPGRAQLHRDGVPTWLDPPQVFPRLGLPGKRLLSGSFCGASHVLKIALGEASGVDGPRPACSPRGLSVVSFGLGFRTLNPGLVGTSRYRILRVRSSRCWSGVYRLGSDI